MKRILGIDCSSTTTGICLLDWDEITNDLKFVSVEYIKPIKTGSIVDRIAHTRDKIKNIIQQAHPDYIAIEDIISFMKGKSTAQTIIMLTTFNRMMCLLAYDHLGKSPELFNVMSIRHGLKTGTVLPPKEEMPELVAGHLNIKFPYERARTGKIKMESYDKADAVAVALYYGFILSGRIKKKVKKSVKKEPKK